jgi:MFS family permease
VSIESTPIEAEKPPSSEIQKRNYRYVLIDVIGVGLASAAGPFLPVFLTYMNATSVQIGLLTSMPGITGFLMAIPIGRFLQTRRNIVPWFSFSRLLVISAYALTGLVPFLVPDEYVVPAVLLIWALVTLPQTMVAVCFSVVMNAVAGPEGRYDLLSKRWAILGLTTAITVALTGLVLDRMNFPINYQVVFLSLSLGGLISYYFSSKIKLPDSDTLLPVAPDKSLLGISKNYIMLVRSEPAFVSFTFKRFIYLSGLALAAPLFPLYFVRELHASNAWIGILNMAQSTAMMIGYFIWARQSRRYGSRFVLLITTFVVAFYPAMVALAHRQWMILVYATIAGVFQAGMDLVFFDELMKTIPPTYSPTFVSLAQSIQYLSTIIAPMLGTYLAEQIGISGALIAATIFRLIGFGLFAYPDKRKGKVA